MVIFSQINSFKIKLTQLYVPILAILILSSGLLLRSYNWGNNGFGFDQIQILENAENIQNGDYTLIGPRTGPAQMFTGPLIYYITTILLSVTSSLAVLPLLSGLIAFLTAITIFIIYHKYNETKLGLIALFVWAFSPFLISQDRITWNPNLILLASSLVYIPSYFSLKLNKINWFAIFCISLGVFLGYQAHFSGLMLIGLSFITIISLKKINAQVLILAFTSILSFIISLIPTILFDFRNQWFNLKGFSSFLQSENSFSIIFFFRQLLNNLLISIENIGKVIALHNHQTQIYSLGIIIIIIYFYFQYRQNSIISKQNIYTIIWILIPVLAYCFYKGSTPEYYYLIQIPAIIQIFAILIRLIPNHLLILILIPYVIYSSWLTFNIYSNNNGLSIYNQVNVANYIKHYFKQPNSLNISYDLRTVDALGLQYLLKDISNSSKASEKIHISLKSHPESLSQYSSGNVNFWIDPRKEDKSYLEQNSHIIMYPKTIELYQDFINPYEGSRNLYQIFDKEGQKKGQIVFYYNDGNNKFREVEKIIETKPAKTPQIGEWFLLYQNNQPYYIQADRKRNITIIYPQGLSSDIISQISIFTGE